MNLPPEIIHIITLYLKMNISHNAKTQPCLNPDCECVTITPETSNASHITCPLCGDLMAKLKQRHLCMHPPEEDDPSFQFTYGFNIVLDGPLTSDNPKRKTFHRLEMSYCSTNSDTKNFMDMVLKQFEDEAVRETLGKKFEKHKCEGKTKEDMN